jgi:hypothetical protein
MVVKSTPPAPAEAPIETVQIDLPPTALPETGFNVTLDGEFLGNFETQADAEAYIAGHVPGAVIA